VSVETLGEAWNLSWSLTMRCLHDGLEGLKHKRACDYRVKSRPTDARVYPHGMIVQLLLLNGQRRGETANLRWPWIDEKERTITLPEWITKNKKEHTFPYDDMTAAILETVPRRNTTDLLFPSKVSDERPVPVGANPKRGWMMA